MATKKPIPPSKASTPEAKKPVSAAKTPVSATKETGSPAKAPTATTVTLKQLAPALAETSNLSKQQSEAMLNSLVEMVTERLKAGDKVRLTGLGILQVRDRPARTGRNPATGQPIEIKASKKIAFTASKELKDAV
ncbi:HU family DNA-binding protein [Belnapia sp. F-4-1]|uniref:HU family DNA-binding protein n=1 Tax=Belnapia sp. F-4-1 TaxID=1545443 RepID=UPI0009DD2EE4|nr:HU family DNA-binding protein [Belnapia sp. F-4-1]